MWGCQSTTPVKAKTIAPTPDLPTTCAALTRRGLERATHTGSRERGVGLRQTLDWQVGAWERLTVGRKDATGTVWATPLEHRLPALAKDLAALSVLSGTRRARVTATQAACCRGACIRFAASNVAVW